MWKARATVRACSSSIGQAFLEIRVTFTNSKQTSSAQYTIISSIVRLELTSGSHKLCLESPLLFENIYPHQSATYRVPLRKDIVIPFHQARAGMLIACDCTIAGLETSAIKSDEMNTVHRTQAFDYTFRLNQLDLGFWIEKLLPLLSKRSLLIEVELPELPNVEGLDSWIANDFACIYQLLEKMIAAAHQRNSDTIFIAARDAADVFYDGRKEKLFKRMPGLKDFIECRWGAEKNEQPWAKRWKIFKQLRQIINEGHHGQGNLVTAMFVATQLPPVMLYFINAAIDMLREREMSSSSESSDSDEETEKGKEKEEFPCGQNYDSSKDLPKRK
ncbi:hypothetical protein QOT17_014353 [Balamuthia mandrillaris]